MKAVYPVILTYDGEEPHPYFVTVPDFDANTEGDSIEDAIYMARDLISLMGICLEDDKKPIPTPKTLNPKHKKGDILTLVDVDFDAYRRSIEKRSVKKTVTLPSWLNELAEKNAVNFSQVLQEGLKNTLHVQDR